jgi:hypothetical protein
MSPRPRQPGKTRATPPSPPAPQNRGLEDIVPPGKLQAEDRDSAITGSTRSLQRRVMGLDVLKAHPPTKPRGKKSAAKSD